MTWEIVYYSDEVQDAILAFPARLQARYVHLTERMLTFGPDLLLAHSSREAPDEQVSLDAAIEYLKAQGVGIHVDVKQPGYEERVARLIDVFLAGKRSDVRNCVGSYRDSWRLHNAA